MDLTGTKAWLWLLTKETLVASMLYLGAFFVTFSFLMPVQRLIFPQYLSFASLLFLPHGIRVLSGWLMGWRSSVALLPGAFLAFFYIAGLQVFTLGRLIGVVIAVTVAPATFHALKLMGWDMSPKSGRPPCWACVMFAGILASLIGAGLTNMALGNGPVDYVAYLIGDVSGLFFLMLILMLVFRSQRNKR
jgi:hypothetical protein